MVCESTDTEASADFHLHLTQGPAINSLPLWAAPEDVSFVIHQYQAGEAVHIELFSYRAGIATAQEGVVIHSQTILNHAHLADLLGPGSAFIG